MRVYEKEGLVRILREQEKVTKEDGGNCAKKRATNCTVKKIFGWKN